MSTQQEDPAVPPPYPPGTWIKTADGNLYEVKGHMTVAIWDNALAYDCRPLLRSTPGTGLLVLHVIVQEARLPDGRVARRVV